MKSLFWNNEKIAFLWTFPLISIDKALDSDYNEVTNAESLRSAFISLRDDCTFFAPLLKKTEDETNGKK